jgi:hypothetical protein
MKQVYMAENPVEAHMVVDLLGAEGIAAVVQGENLFAIRGVVPISYPTVWVVDDEDYGRGRALALEYDRGQYSEVHPARRGPWTCSTCGEVSEGQFDQCWQCGAARPEE